MGYPCLQELLKLRQKKDSRAADVTMMDKLQNESSSLLAQLRLVQQQIGKLVITLLGARHMCMLTCPSHQSGHGAHALLQRLILMWYSLCKHALQALQQPQHEACRGCAF